MNHDRFYIAPNGNGDTLFDGRTGEGLAHCADYPLLGRDVRAAFLTRTAVTLNSAPAHLQDEMARALRAAEEAKWD